MLSLRIWCLRYLFANDKSFPVPLYIVKIYLNRLLPVIAEPCYLYIGDKRIYEYGTFSKGIYFRIYDKKELEELEGNKVLITLPRGKVITSIESFPLYSTLIKTIENISDIDSLPNVKQILSY